MKKLPDISKNCSYLDAKPGEGIMETKTEEAIKYDDFPLSRRDQNLD